MRTEEIKQLIGTSHRVNTDPRVTASREALEAFLASAAGRVFEAATHGPNAKVKLAAVPDDIKDMYEVHAINHVITRRRVVREIRDEHPQDYTSIVNHLLGA